MMFPIQKSDKKIKKNLAFVSVIVAAKNEELNIERCVNAILKQDYPNFELIVVDDYSTDGTSDILKGLQSTDHRITIILPSKDLPGKKLAITEAISIAKGPQILLTDADCVPVSDQWIATMLSNITNDKLIVLGYGPLMVENHWINTFSRYETLLAAMQYFSYAHMGRPYMGVGRNLMFDKQLFIDNNGYQSHMQHASGDDDLFIQEVATASNVALCTDQLGHVLSPSMDTLESYIRQKKRHLNSSIEYKMLDKVLLSIYPFSIIFIYFLSILLLWSPYVNFVIVSIILRWVILMLFYIKPARQLKSLDLIWKYPFLEMLHIVYLIYFAFTAFNSKKHNWNG